MKRTKPPKSVFILCFAVPMALCLLLGGCSTVANEKGFRTYGDVKHLEYKRSKDGAVSLVMDGVDHSKPTRAAGSVAGTIGTSVVSGITAAATGL